MTISSNLFCILDVSSIFTQSPDTRRHCVSSLLRLVSEAQGLHPWTSRELNPVLLGGLSLQSDAYTTRPSKRLCVGDCELVNIQGI